MSGSVTQADGSVGRSIGVEEIPFTPSPSHGTRIADHGIAGPPPTRLPRRHRWRALAPLDFQPMDATVADALNGALLGGRYRIRGRLARGGMATVYHAVDERLDRHVAIKVMDTDAARDRQVAHGLHDEA